MNKTITIHIQGLPFIFEEKAYEILEKYMDKLAVYFQDDQDKAEIMMDIELRIAELCSALIVDSKKVIEEQDINSILANLGEPELIDAETHESHEKEHRTSQSYKSERAFFRDEEEAKIAGVCAGISNYFSIDVLIVRIIFLIILFFGGFGIPLYIILWILLPKAQNSIDKLRMKGKAITIENVRDEVETAASRFSKSSRSFAKKFRENNEKNKRFSLLANFLRKTWGIFMLVIAALTLVLLMFYVFNGAIFFPFENENNLMTLNDLFKLVFDNNSDIFYLNWGVILCLSSFGILVLINGIKNLFRLKSKVLTVISYAFIFLLLLGISACFYVGINFGKDIAASYSVEEQVFSMKTDVLKIQTHSYHLSNFHHVDLIDDDDDYHQPELIVKDNNFIQQGLEFKIIRSKDSTFNVYHHKKAYANSTKLGIKRAKNIQQEIQVLKDDVLKIPCYFSYPKVDKIRKQELNLIIEIPSYSFVEINGRKIGFKMEDEGTNVLNGYINYNGEIEIW